MTKEPECIIYHDSVDEEDGRVYTFEKSNAKAKQAVNLYMVDQVELIDIWDECHEHYPKVKVGESYYEKWQQYFKDDEGNYYTFVHIFYLVKLEPEDEEYAFEDYAWDDPETIHEIIINDCVYKWDGEVYS